MQIKARRALSQPNERCRPQDRLPEPVTGPPQGRPLPARHQSSPSCHQLERCARNRRRCRHRCRGAEQWFTFRLNGQTDDDVFLDVRSISGRPKLAKRGSWFRIVKFCSSSFANQFRDRGSPACPERRAARLLRLRWSDTASISEKTSLLGHLCWVSSSVWSRVRRAYASTQARRRCGLRHRQWPATREKRKEGSSRQTKAGSFVSKTKGGSSRENKSGGLLENESGGLACVIDVRRCLFQISGRDLPLSMDGACKVIPHEAQYVWLVTPSAPLRSSGTNLFPHPSNSSPPTTDLIKLREGVLTVGDSEAFQRDLASTSARRIPLMLRA